MQRRSLLTGLAATAFPTGVRGEELRPLRIGVLGDPTGIGAFGSGAPTLAAARMAAADFGPLPNGRPVEVLSGSFRLKPDEALAIARHWFDDLQVSAIVDLPTAAAAAAVQDLAHARDRTVLNTSSISPELAGRACAAIATQWACDSIALTGATVRGLAEDGGRSWYLIVPDTAVALAIQHDARRAIETSGGTLIGLSQHPSGAADFTAPVMEAVRSGAQAIGLCAIGDDLAGTVRQGRTSGLFGEERRVAAFVTSIGDIHALGAAAAEGLWLADGFYWNESEPTRLFSNRFVRAAGRMPGMSQATTYAAVLHYLRAVAAADTLDAVAINVEMRRTPVYFFGRTGHIRLDGRVMLDVTQYKVQLPGTGGNDWDCYKSVRTMPAAQVYRPFGQDGCTLAP